MFLFHNRPVSIMVLYAISLHFFWAGVLLYDNSALGATSISALHRYVTSPGLLVVTLLSAAVLAFIGIYTRRLLIVLFLLPQQILLMMTAAGAIEAIWLAQYADGVFRARAFIAVDQIYSVLAALGHTAAIVAHARRVVH